MLKNYIHVGFRNIFKHKPHSFINIFGLAIAIASSILLANFVKHELSYDSFHDHGEQIFRINSTHVVDNRAEVKATTQAPLGPVLKSEIPEVQYATRFICSDYSVIYQDNIFYETVTFTDPDFLRMFSFKLLQGNPDHFLSDKNTIVVSERIASKIFGNTNPVGKNLSVMRFGVSYDFTVYGVIENAPENSSIQYDIIVPFEKIRDLWGADYFQNWGLYSVHTYIQISFAALTHKVQSKIPAIIGKYSEEKTTFTLQQLPDVHFASTVQATLSPSSSITYSYLLTGITLLLLFVAIFNSMNFSSAMAAMRFKEIGVRKVLGAARSQIIIQLCVESIILTFVAFILGVLIAELFSPIFSRMVDKSLNISNFSYLYFFGQGIILIITVGVLSAIFPAMVLSRFAPSDIYRGRHFSGNKSYFSRSLIVVQFGVSIFLIMCSLVMADQLNFLSAKNLGFIDEQIVAIPLQYRNSQQVLDTYRSELKRYSQVVHVSGAIAYPGGSFHRAQTIEGEKSITSTQIKIDYDFLETFGITLKEGRNFSRNISSDTTEAVIVNEAFVDRMGWQTALGKKVVIEWMGWDLEVIGVIKDFHYSSFHEPIGPLVFFMDPYVPLDFIFVKILPENPRKTVAILKETWHDVVPNHAFEYFFIDEKFHQQYKSEQRWTSIVLYSSVLAVLIACFGLFGLSALIMTRRTKEIGIRKVVGASAKSINAMLANQFLKWIILANLIAWPAGYFAMHKWLQNFAYKITIGWEVFIFSGIIVLIVASVTVLTLALRVALANPVEVLRYE